MSLGANSGSEGILIYEGKSDKSFSVYGYYEADKLNLIDGDYAMTYALKKKHDERDNNDKRVTRLMSIAILIYLILLAGVIVLTVRGYLGIYRMIVLTVFLFGSFLPFASMFMNLSGFYNSKEDHKRYRRFHGAEHKMMYCVVEGESVDMENMKSKSIYADECGNVYTSSIFFYFLMWLVLMLNITSVGIVKTIIILVLLPVVLFFNMMNPWNPFKLFQHFAIAQPTDREMELAIKAYERFAELRDK